MFSVFRDTAAKPGGEHATGAQWDDLGTVKSRKRENDIEATEWKGETLPMTGAHSATKPGAFKLEVFRDTVSLHRVRRRFPSLPWC
jgi:checkpoint serine/threonine-protein kinase